eukprot:SAG22_NODE_7283_length_755_cov_0.974085_1_plen_39_part_10
MPAASSRLGRLSQHLRAEPDATAIIHGPLELDGADDEAA